ncbi:MAG: hypothetical protein H0U05_09830 [Actinobacteria bacterium]|nr:hypothetical protein [Actinomycetota bacterium]
MKTLSLVAGLCFLAAAGSATGALTQEQRPSLAVTDTRPFEVRGVGFEPRERVQVLLAVNGTQRWRGAIASQAGVFTVEFRAPLGACSRFTVRAYGSKGSTARIVPRRAQIDCASPTSGSSTT